MENASIPARILTYYPDNRTKNSLHSSQLLLFPDPISTSKDFSGFAVNLRGQVNSTASDRAAAWRLCTSHAFAIYKTARKSNEFQSDRTLCCRFAESGFFCFMLSVQSFWYDFKTSFVNQIHSELQGIKGEKLIFYFLIIREVINVCVIYADCFKFDFELNTVQTPKSN